MKLVFQRVELMKRGLVIYSCRNFFVIVTDMLGLSLCTLLQALRRVLAPKAGALRAWQASNQLHPFTTHASFSSIASLLGSLGQAAYAAANGVLDGAAHSAAAQRMPHTSLQWGAWAGGGMAARDAATSARLQRLGLGLITPRPGPQGTC